MLGAGPADAEDGVNETKQTSMVAAGGPPFLIGVSGSYVLTSNLTTLAAVSGLVVTVPNVEIDLTASRSGSRARTT